MFETDSDKPGNNLLVVVILNVFALLELVGGAYLMVNAKTTSLTSTIPTGLGGITIPSTTESHDWVTGFTYMAIAIFAAALLVGFGHLIADVHDLKYEARRQTEVLDED